MNMNLLTVKIDSAFRRIHLVHLLYVQKCLRSTVVWWQFFFYQIYIKSTPFSSDMEIKQWSTLVLVLQTYRQPFAFNRCDWWCFVIFAWASNGFKKFHNRQSDQSHDWISWCKYFIHVHLSTCELDFGFVRLVFVV